MWDDGTADGTEADERVLNTAIRLFAELGYDATSLDLIAHAAGAETQESRLLRDGKPLLYRAVFDRFRTLEETYFETAAKDVPGDVEGVHRLVDAAVDFTVAYPEVNAVWGHRALKDAIDLDFPDGFTPGLETALTSRTWTGVRDDVDFRFLAWTVIWQVMGFAGTGLPCEAGRAHSDDSPALAYFRAQLHELIDCRIRAPGHTG